MIRQVGAKSYTPQVNILNQSAISMDAGCVYSLRLYDTDSGTDVWSSLAAHNGIIYDITWSADDFYILTTSGDGTSKVWDVYALYVIHQKSNVKRSVAIGESSVTTGVAGNIISPSKAPNIPDGNTIGGSIVDSQVAELTPPSCILTMVASPPVYVYAGVFQDHSLKSMAAMLMAVNASSPGSNLNGGSIESLHNSMVGDHRPPPPRVITGSSDGKLRVWEGGSLLGYITIPSAATTIGSISPRSAAPGGAAEDPAHMDRVQVLVIDERTRSILLIAFI